MFSVQQARTKSKFGDDADAVCFVGAQTSAGTDIHRRNKAWRNAEGGMGDRRMSSKLKGKASYLRSVPPTCMPCQHHDGSDQLPSAIW